MNTLFRTLLTFVVIIIAAGDARAAVPARITFTARLVKEATPVDGSVQVGLRLFRTASGGTSVWDEIHDATAAAGLVSLGMGELTPLDASVIDGSSLFLEVSLDNTVLSPRLAIGSVPYAFLAEQANSATKLGTLKEADVQRRTAVTNNMSCPLGQYMRTIAQTGQATCAPALTCSYKEGTTSGGTASVTCPSGTIVMGGGCSSPNNTQILDSYPSTASKWDCRTTSSAQVQAIAICCDISF